MFFGQEKILLVIIIEDDWGKTWTLYSQIVRQIPFGIKMVFLTFECQRISQK